MSFKQLDRWFRSVGCVPAERLHFPPELAGRKGYYLPVLGETRPPEVAADGRLVKRVVLTTPALDRQGDIVVPTGAKLRWFRKNPVVLWAHRYDMPPVGAVEADSIRVSEAGIEADVVFDAGSAAGREVFGLYDRGVMRGWSIGFVPLKWKVLEDEKTGKVRGYRVEEWELLELSAVPVPANPEALTRCLQEMESRPEDPRLAPVLNTLKAAVGWGSPHQTVSKPAPVSGKDAAKTHGGVNPTLGFSTSSQTATEPGGAGLNPAPASGRTPPDGGAKPAEKGDIEGRIMAFERRMEALEAAESRQGTAADRPRPDAEKALAAAVAEALSARLPAALEGIAQNEFDRRMGAV